MATAITTPAQAVQPPRHPLAAILTGWHLLSLDAPTVAAVWTIFVARVFSVALPWTAPAALALAVWILYACDRLADAAHASEALAERHRFHHRNRVAFAGAILGATPALILLIVLLPPALRAGWLFLAAPMAMYVAAVHLLRLRRVPKENLVAIFFAVATAMPALTTYKATLTSLAPAMAAFGALCWLNCVAIGRWEHVTSMDAATAFAGSHFGSASAAVLFISAFSLWSHPAIFVACAGAVLLLLVLERTRPGTTLLRTLADAALLTPLAILPFLHPQ